MKFAILLASAASFAALTPPVCAQEPTATHRAFGAERRGAHVSVSTGALTREAVRLAAAHGSSPALQHDDVQQVAKTGRADWAGLRNVAPGNAVDIVVSTMGADGHSAPILTRYFVSADDSSLTVLNLSDPALPAAAARALRQIASQHRGFLDGAVRGGTFIVGDVRLAAAGVFVSDQKIADLRDIVETTARTEVLEIRIRQRGRGVWGQLGPVGGYFVGAMSGAYAARLACQAATGRNRCDSGAALTGIALGGIAGAGYGLRAARRETESTIYSAPRCGEVDGVQDPLGLLAGSSADCADSKWHRVKPSVSTDLK
jgi:hypothetical protein